jgi:mannose-1-phosphate guanylyltransferase
MNMLQEAISRLDSLISPDDIFIITSEVLLEPIRNSVTEIPSQNIIAEPAKRNTAPCLALASAVLQARYGNSEQILMAVLTADHKIEPKDKFVEIIDSAFNFVHENPIICTIGIKPDRPETGYGYIELGQRITNNISEVNNFREKPDLITAKEYLDSGNFLWNSGMFFWNLKTFDEQMKIHAPEIGLQIDELSKLYKDFHSLTLDKSNPMAKSVFEKLPSISIDYALMEKSDKVVCIDADFKWDDLGSWDSLDRVRKTDENGNITTDGTYILESTNCTIINDNGSNVVITGIALDNLVVINTKDSILICPKDRAQDVKLIVNHLKDKNLDYLL